MQVRNQTGTDASRDEEFPDSFVQWVTYGETLCHWEFLWASLHHQETSEDVFSYTGQLVTKKGGVVWRDRSHGAEK